MSIEKYKEAKRLYKFSHDLIEEATELKRQNYYRRQEIESANAKIVEIQSSLSQLGIELPKDWSPLMDLNEDDVYGDD